MQLNINTDAAVKFTNTLEKLHRSALPVAIRSALNDAVFDVKTKTMPRSADETFEKRQPNFFKANSKFESAKGFDVNTMKATIGFISDKLKGDSNYAVKDLEEQEHGGAIDKKSFIANKEARTGKGLVKPNARLKNIKNLVNASKSKGANWAQRAIK
ncbi:MAG TPA: hypothetical protein VI522_07470, partial [Gammaproteobacteria bacterium]|nr:hypothetical protein [Gammaproteobacteria bacterium]